LVTSTQSLGRKEITKNVFNLGEGSI